MTKDEELRLALEALEDLGNHDRICPQWPTYAEPENYPKCNCGYDQAITAIKAALEAKDEPVAIFKADLDGGYVDLLAFQGKPLSDNTLLYTTPPQRTWIGLTDEEISDCMEMSIQKTCRAIEAKLRSKNHEI